jgi:ribosomal protein S18 acetylase RimI-like enzyme
MPGTEASAGERRENMDDYTWVYDDTAVDWDELSELYRVAPLGEKPPADLKVVFTNSMFTCFVYADDRLVGVGRALADGLDCAYIADVAVHPDHQGVGLGRAVINRLVSLADGPKKVILYANPGKEGFYARLGFLRMRTAMAIWRNREQATSSGLLDDDA